MEKENMPIVIVTVLAYYPFRTYPLASYAIPLVLYHYLYLSITIRMELTIYL